MSLGKKSECEANNTNGIKISLFHYACSLLKHLLFPVNLRADLKDEMHLQQLKLDTTKPQFSWWEKGAIRYSSHSQKKTQRRETILYYEIKRLRVEQFRFFTVTEGRYPISGCLIPKHTVVCYQYYADAKPPPSQPEGSGGKEQNTVKKL
jgi:hypothetical protein